MMGRSPSHITLECANLTQPNMALISEEVEARRLTLAEVVDELADAVELRAKEGKHFGVVLIPEGLIEFIPQVNALLKEIAAARRLQPAGQSNGTPGTRPVAVSQAQRLSEATRAAAVVEALSPYESAPLETATPPLLVLRPHAPPSSSFCTGTRRLSSTRCLPSSASSCSSRGR